MVLREVLIINTTGGFIIHSMFTICLEFYFISINNSTDLQ